MERRVMKSGATKKSAVASARGIAASAAKNAMFATTMQSPRAMCAPGRRVRSARSPPSNRSIARLNRIATAARTKTISWSG